jgi:hypothetical protein
MQILGFKAKVALNKILEFQKKRYSAQLQEHYAAFLLPARA